MNNNNNNNTNKNNNTKIKQRRKRINRNVQNKRIRTRRRRRRIMLIKNNPTRQAAIGSIPMAIPISYNKYFNMKNMGETAVRIKGCDLIYRIPDNIQILNQTQIITMITANPAYWIGTRISAIAQGYQNYRPLSLKIHYCPQCPVTQQGNVLGGTLWDDVPSPSSFQQSLKTSNGGFLTQCYQPTTSIIRMKSNLQMNLYRMAGDINQQSNPFIFIAMAIACLNSNNQAVNPGIFYVEYDYVLKNPIGNSTNYNNTGIITHTEQRTYYTNAKAIAATNFTINDTEFPPGTQLDIEYEIDRFNFYYNQTPIAPPNIPIWVIMNQPIQQQSLVQKHEEPPIPLKNTLEFNYAYAFRPDTVNYALQAGYASSYMDTDSKFHVAINATANTINIPAPVTDQIYIAREVNQYYLKGLMQVTGTNNGLIYFDVEDVLYDPEHNDKLEDQKDDKNKEEQISVESKN